MDVTDFEAERPRLTAIAARILGSNAEADGVLQEAWLRLSRAVDVDDLPGGTVGVAYAFHVAGGLVRDIELIADPEILATLDVTRRGQAISTR